MNPTNQKIQIIALCGKKRSGKDTIGQYLVDHYGFTRLAFADPLKNACKEIFDFSDEQLDGEDKESLDDYWKETPRRLFQVIGTELMRQTLPQHCPSIDNIWVKSLDRRMMNLIQKGNDKFVITDLRFDSEYQYILSKGGNVWKVEKNIDINKDKQLNTNDFHSSETSFDNFKIHKTFNNNWSKEELYQKVKDTIDELIYN